MVCKTFAQVPVIVWAVLTYAFLYACDPSEIGFVDALKISISDVWTRGIVPLFHIDFRETQLPTLEDFLYLVIGFFTLFIISVIIHLATGFCLAFVFGRRAVMLHVLHTGAPASAAA
jgi:hypothetical protein